MGNDTLEAVDSFCYLGDMISAGGGCEKAIITPGPEICSGDAYRLHSLED